ncbi:hypothetical protein OsI_18152 [Oryza sativa Indica Group]|jgi:hypothetical protein|uniref:Protein kinase domain-containing protein n=1 Tax=Oryza sativa subsp. indica TaxID=39946 RepID=B8AWX9_ORYSI|nr:hypothetical protein OsI_18152 [Oryza sativa Indica Group]
MPPTPPPELDLLDTEPEFAEVDPTARYGRYTEVLGKGAFKTVYPSSHARFLGFDVRFRMVPGPLCCV